MFSFTSFFFKSIAYSPKSIPNVNHLYFVPTCRAKQQGSRGREWGLKKGKTKKGAHSSFWIPGSKAPTLLCDFRADGLRLRQGEWGGRKWCPSLQGSNWSLKETNKAARTALQSTIVSGPGLFPATNLQISRISPETLHTGREHVLTPLCNRSDCCSHHIRL